MSLSSIEFVLLLPTLIGVYWLLFDRRIQQIYLALVTALFIGFAGRFHLWVLAGVLGATMLVIRAANRSASRQQQIIRAGIIGLVVVLLSFKYLSWGFSLVGLQVIPPRQPIGISYYTFILIGFLVDRSRSHRPLTARRVLSLLLFFPFLTSGPIVRLRSWSAQNPRGRKRRVMRNVTIGAHSFMIGLMKKVMIADAIAVSTAPVWANPGQYGRTALAVAIVGFYVQLYADFSGYTDMARGVARMLGFHLPINFRAPYFATTPMDFWSRWHMTLTGWIRDYAFTPLSMIVWRRFSSRRFNSAITFALSVLLMTMVGLWHGASASFVWFGAFHGVLIGTWYAVVGNGRRLRQGSRVVSWALFQALLMLSMTMFRADTLSRAGAVLSGVLSSVGAETMHDSLVGLALATAAIGVFQYFEFRPRRQLARLRGDLRLFPVFLGLIVLIVYMKGLTLEGVWISPADPFFNRGQEKFIYLQF